MNSALSLIEQLSKSPYLSLSLFISFIICLVLIGWVLRLERKLSRLLGDNSVSLEHALETLHKQAKTSEEFQNELEKYLETVETRLNKNIQSVETVRFNPFKGSGSGGNQSFSTAFLNEKGDGVVISSLYTRDRVSVFAKPVKKLNSEFELSDEEKESIEKASTGLFKSRP